MLVAQRIVRDIGRAGLRPGDLLPPERAMLETYETGRGTLREALRLLEFQGVITLKPGPGGGPILMNPAAAHLASTLQLLMQLNQAPYQTLIEARSALEPVLSRLAAERIGTEALANDMAGSAQRKMLQTMHTSARHGLDMIKQILAFARGVGGKPAILDIGTLFREMQELAHETFARSIRIEVRSNAQLFPVLGNPTQLRQVLLNLCVNARDAMPAGGSLKLTAENATLENKVTPLQSEPVSGPHVMIEVSDTGHGIEPHVLQKIFEPFFTTKEPGKGTGLGLSTVQGIVKSHGGFLDVVSEVGKGTTFTVFLPAHQNAS